MAPRATSDLERRLRELAEPLVAGQGLEIVEAAFGRRGRRWHVRLDIDRPGPAGVGLDECARVSGALGEALDESDLFDDSYVLEVSSPGLDRPIRTDDDVRRNRGRRVVVDAREPVRGRTRFRGVLLGGEDGSLRIHDDDLGEVAVPKERILKAQQEIEFR